MPGQRAPEEERRDQILTAALKVAARDRLDQLTVRRVASEAGLSPGLVFFHFGSKEGLLVALLDRLIAELIPADTGERIPEASTARDRLLAMIHREIARLPEERDEIELFFDFWVMGTRHPAIRKRIRAALAAYRASFQPIAADVIAEERGRFPDTTAEDLAGLIVGFLQGNAVQGVMDPTEVSPEAMMTTLEALVPPPR